MRKPLTTLLILSILAIMPIGCDMFCNDSCGCGPSNSPRTFSILSLEALTLDQNGNEINSSDFSPYNEVVKGLRIKDFETIALKDTDLQASSIPGIAYACSPLPPKSASNITTIQIINKKETILSEGMVVSIGDDISQRFGMYSFNASESLPIEEFLEENKVFYLNDILKLEWTSDPEKDLILIFSIKIILQNGKEFLLENQKLSIK